MINISRLGIKDQIVAPDGTSDEYVVLPGETNSTIKVSGVSDLSRQALIDIANDAELNNSVIKSDIITKLNAKGLALLAGATWADVQSGIPNIVLNKREADGTGTASASSGVKTISGLLFRPKLVVVSIQDTTLNDVELMVITDGLLLYKHNVAGGKTSVVQADNPWGVHFESWESYGSILASGFTFNSYLVLNARPVLYSWWAFE